MNIDVRALEPRDAAVVAALHARAGVGRPWTAVEYAALLARADVYGALAAAGDDAIGFALWSMIAGEAELYEIAVDTGWRRQGVGRLLMTALEAALRHNCVPALHLEVAEDNVAARRLYHAVGFAPVGRRVGYYTEGSVPVDALMMRKEI